MSVTPPQNEAEFELWKTCQEIDPQNQLNLRVINLIHDAVHYNFVQKGILTPTEVLRTIAEVMEMWADRTDEIENGDW